MVETTLNSSKAWSPDVVAFPPAEAVPDSMILRASTVAGSVEGDDVAVRVPYVDDATAGFIAEGGVMDESDPGLSEATVFTGKIGQLIRISREQFVQDMASGLLSDSVRRAVTTAGNNAFIAQEPPTSPDVTPPSGLLHVDGVVDGGNVDGDLDALIDLQATIATNGGVPSVIVLSPTAWASLRQFKTADGSNQGLLGAGVEDVTPALLNTPVIVSPAVPVNTGLMIDRTAVVSAVGDVLVAQSSDVYFASDSIGLRATWRFGQAVTRPERVGYFTVAAPEGS